MPQPLKKQLTRHLLTPLALLALAACDDGAKATPEAGAGGGAEAGAGAGAGAGAEGGAEGGALPPPVGEEGCAVYLRDPAAHKTMTFPDDALTQPAPTPTGLRLDLAGLPWASAQTPFVQRLLADLDTVDGWGINAGVVMRFSAPVEGLPSGPETGAPGSAVQLVMLSGEEELPLYPRQVPVEVRYLDGGKGVIFEPMRPLRPATRYGLAVSQRAPEGAGGACLAPSEASRALLRDPAPAHAPHLAESYAALAAAVSIPAPYIAAATVFTTQSTPLLSFEVAEDIKGRSYSWNDDLDCRDDGAVFRLCTRSFDASDYREGGVIVDSAPKGTHAIKVYHWKPKASGAGATPLMMYGHGIGGDVTNAYAGLSIVKDDGVSVVAVDAVAHGEHPDAPSGPGDTSTATVFQFFALNLTERTIEARKARDNFRQSTYEKLQLVELLHQDPDVDGDGEGDVDLSRLSYYGLSLGGIMGVELLALEPRLRASLLAVPGARLVSVITDGNLISSFLPAIYALVGGEDTFNSFTPLAQAILDGADPGSFAPWVLHHRKDGATPPHVLMQMAINDEVVPNPANRALARGLGLQHVRPVAQEVGLLEEVSPPAAGGLPGFPGVTGALFQFDRVVRGASTIVPSTHMNVPDGREGVAQARSFLRPWLAGETPEVRSPYPQ